jgi:hypothetical protein
MSLGQLAPMLSPSPLATSKQLGGYAFRYGFKYVSNSRLISSGLVIRRRRSNARGCARAEHTPGNQHVDVVLRKNRARRLNATELIERLADPTRGSSRRRKRRDPQGSRTGNGRRPLVLVIPLAVSIAPGCVLLCHCENHSIRHIFLPIV